MHIQAATPADLPQILAIYAHARQFMAEHDNPKQWENGDPPQALVESDIARGCCYLCMQGEQIAAVFYFAQEEDPTYHVIDGQWCMDGPYGVVHRIASSHIARGAGSFCLQWAFAQCGNVRIDTHEDNYVMQNLLAKNGFVRCGTIYLENGSPRIAYQKVL